MWDGLDVLLNHERPKPDTSNMQDDQKWYRQKFRPTKPGKLPSLARAMAMKGPRSFTMSLLQETPASSTITSGANAAEKHWDWLLGPNLNSRTPFGGAQRVNWQILLHNKLDRPETTSLKDRVLLMVQGGTAHAPLEDLLLLLSVCDKHVSPEFLNKLFRQVSGRVRKEWGVILRRRWVIPLPSHEEELCTRMTKLCRQAVTAMSIPQGRNTWLKHSLAYIPLAGPKALIASQYSAPQRAT